MAVVRSAKSSRRSAAERVAWAAAGRGPVEHATASPASIRKPDPRNRYRGGGIGLDAGVALALAPRRAAAVEPAVAPAFEVVIQSVEVDRVEPHLLGRRHALVMAAVHQDVEEFLPSRHVAVRLEGVEQAGPERTPLTILAMAPGALQAVLLPRLVEPDLDGVARRRVVRIGKGSG